METFVRPAIHDATDGEEIDRIPDDTPFGNVAGLASRVVFASTSDDLVAYGLPDLEERWRVRVGEAYRTWPLPHGVLVRTADALVALTSG
jgi:hypothetical protein